jgi:pyridoxamine 5'-phosphate oxidase
VADLRKDYRAGALDRGSLDPDPIRFFEQWFRVAATAEGIVEPNAMTLSTAGADGEVSARIVLLKGFDADGFRFFTNCESRKGRQIAANPRVALSFYWGPLDRQVLIAGSAEMLPREEAAAYFQTRPIESRLGAWASRQSEVVASRAVLELALEQARQRHADGDVPLPPWWGGYLVRPATIEFWQGRPGRLHDRFRYTRASGGGWRIERLSP